MSVMAGGTGPFRSWVALNQWLATVPPSALVATGLTIGGAVVFLGWRSPR